MSASTQCPHTDVHYHLNTVIFGDTNIRYLEVKGRCNVCDATARFRGPLGMSPNHPTVSMDGTEANMPLMFGDEEYDGNAHGYTVQVSGG